MTLIPDEDSHPGRDEWVRRSLAEGSRRKIYGNPHPAKISSAKSAVWVQLTPNQT